MHPTAHITGEVNHANVEGGILQKRQHKIVLIRLHHPRVGGGSNCCRLQACQQILEFFGKRLLIVGRQPAQDRPPYRAGIGHQAAGATALMTQIAAQLGRATVAVFYGWFLQQPHRLTQPCDLGMGS